MLVPSYFIRNMALAYQLLTAGPTYHTLHFLSTHSPTPSHSTLSLSSLQSPQAGGGAPPASLAGTGLDGGRRGRCGGRPPDLVDGGDAAALLPRRAGSPSLLPAPSLAGHGAGRRRGSWCSGGAGRPCSLLLPQFGAADGPAPSSSLDSGRRRPEPLSGSLSPAGGLGGRRARRPRRSRRAVSSARLRCPAPPSSLLPPPPAAPDLELARSTLCSPIRQQIRIQT